MGENFDAQMTSYFEDFKKSMKQRMIIPVSLVDKHVMDICFLVDIDYTYIQAIIPRAIWLRPLGYELNVDQASTTIIALLAKEVDKAGKHFGTYDVVKSKLVTDLKMATTVKKKDKLIKKLKKIFGVDIGEARMQKKKKQVMKKWMKVKRKKKSQNKGHYNWHKA